MWDCGRSMIKRTGTGKLKVRYDYYHCSAAKLQGRSQCPAPARMREDHLNEIVMSAVCDEFLRPDRVSELVDRICELRESNADTDGASLKQLKLNRSQLARELTNLIRAVAEGAFKPSEWVRSQQDHLETELATVRALIEAKEKTIQAEVQRLAPDAAASFCATLREKLRTAPPKTKRRLIHALVEVVEVSPEGIRLRGSGGDVADLTHSLDEAHEIAAPGVRSSIRKWRSGRDSNPRYGFAVYSLSRRAPSTTRPPLRISLEGRASKGRCRTGQGCRP